MKGKLDYEQNNHKIKIDAHTFRARVSSEDALDALPMVLTLQLCSMLSLWQGATTLFFYPNSFFYVRCAGIYDMRG